MSLALVQSRALLGLDAPPVTVEVHLANGLPSFTLVGLAAWLAAAVALALPFLKRRVTRVWWIVLAVGTLISLNAAMIIAAMPQPVY